MTEPRRRLSPEDRREQLLDVACNIVEVDGVTECTIDAVSQRAGVTPQLVHKYFGTRPSLLRALFVREEARYEEKMRAALADAVSFEDVVRVFVTANFDQLSDGTAIGRLLGTPEVAPEANEVLARGQGGATARLLTKSMRSEYPASPRTVELALRLGSAASIEAGKLAGGRRQNRTADIEDTLRFIMAGIAAVAEHDTDQSAADDGKHIS